jgi:ABC-type dipeptide/oligopeptide/nickel transport system permease subunit
MSTAPATRVAERAPASAPARPGLASSRAIRRMARTPTALIAFGILAVLILCAVAAPAITRFDPVRDQSYSDANQGPSSTHWFGTDYLGRDTFARVVYGSRVSLTVGTVSVGIGLIVGVLTGLVAGFYGGKVDALLMRITDAIWTFPSLMLALAITSVLGPGIFNAMIAIGVVGIPYFARLARASTLTVRELDFVLAARALGMPSPRILIRHVLPNIAAPIIVQGSLAFGAAVITEASLSFLGVGVQPPTPSWGIELRSGYQYMELNPSAAIVPGVAIFITVLACNFLGDGLRVALDPKLQQRGS